MFRSLLIAAVSLFALALLPASAFADGPAQYVGAKKCKKCHGDVYKSWKKTALAKSFEALKPGVKAAEKTKAGLDPEKDYTTDEKCLGCHTTGYGKPGGYAIGSKTAAKFEGVQCEACHGPGSNYNPIMDDVKKQKRKYKTSEMEAAGLVLPTKANCETCHSKESPFFTGEFNFEEMKKKGTHEHKPLEYREEG